MADFSAIQKAAGAYSKALNDVSGGSEAKNDGGASFKDVLGGIADQASTATAKSELASMQALSGQADVVDVVTAVQNAELVVQTVVAVRDKVITAYNDIIKMPI
jgi:flagellar hook-basal body complex protein FliE